MILSYRIFVTHLERDADFDRLLTFLKRHHRAIDEISLFTEYWHHSYYPLDRFSELASILSRRMSQLRTEGFSSVGINMLDTTGHLDEAWDFLPSLPFQAAVGHDGKVSRSCACANTKDFLAYIRSKYRMIAELHPDFIWIDDDLRLKNKGIPFPCFCQTCLQLFCVEESRTFLSREDLVEALNEPSSGPLRQAWIGFNRKTLENLLREITDVVHGAGPDIDLGLMTAPPSSEGCLSLYSGLEIPRALELIGGTRLRPGGGFYDDERPRMMINKALTIAEQCQNLPDKVTDVQYELENFPYQKLGKSIQTVLNECTLALASGCSGIAFNALKDLPGSFEDFEELFSTIERQKPFWKSLTKGCESLSPAGLWCAFDSRLEAHRQVPARDWFEYQKIYDVSETYSFAHLGLPLTASLQNSCTTLLAGRIAEAFADDELVGFLRKGVILDSHAVAVMWERGLGALTGVELGSAFDNGVFERFTDHALNISTAGESRDGRVSFWSAQARQLIPLSEKTEALAELVGYNGSRLGSCLSIFQNELGGRVAVQAYCPWSQLNSGAKRLQILEIADWTSRKTVPLRIDAPLRVVPFVRTSADNQHLLSVLINTGYDSTEDFTVRLRGVFTDVAALSPTGEWKSIAASNDGFETRILIPDLAPWRLTVIKATL
jgi:hypothetical protein